MLSRRDFLFRTAFLSFAAACRTSSAAAALDTEASRLSARPSAPRSSVLPGRYPLTLGGDRDGFLYVPPSYSWARPAPLVVLLHGAGHSSTEWGNAPLDEMFGTNGIVALVPDSRGGTWDLPLGGFGPDVRFIDAALQQTFGRINVDARHIALAGFSDGGSYALSLGLSNGDLFNAVIALSPGFFTPGPIHGTPRIFEAHGTQDGVLPIDATSRVIVPQLRERGYDVTYVEFLGPHAIIVPIVNEAALWFVKGRVPPG